MGKKKEETAESRTEKQVREMQDFLEHLGAYVIVIGMLFVLNLTTSSGDWWFQWIAFFWGIGLAFHAADVFLDDGGSLARRLVEGRMGTAKPATPAPEAEPEATTMSAPAAASDSREVSQILTDGSRLVDDMRRSARTIPLPEVRHEALRACASSDNVLSAIAEHPDEVVMARDFLHQFLEPASKLVHDYARLASREVPSARETLRAVEEQDFPQLSRRADAIYDRLHRGTLIDLEVAREMMALDSPEPPRVMIANNEERPALTVKATEEQRET